MTPQAEPPIAASPRRAGFRRAGLRRYLVKFRTALVRGGCLTITTASVPEPARTTSQIPPVNVKPSVNTPTVFEASHPVSAPTEALSAVSVEVVSSDIDPKESAPDGPRFFFKDVTQQEKVMSLFAKHGIPLEPCEWPVLPAPAYKVQWVEKPIRMRVRRYCHRCQTTFGLDRACKKCGHTLCRKCPRFPPKEAKETAEGTNAEEEEHNEARKEVILTLMRRRSPSRQLPPPTRSRRGGSDLVRRPAKQKVRRTCHKCDTIFARQEKVCRNCQHVRCTACPRDPPKIDKWPRGYPGDVEAEADDDPGADYGREELGQHDEWSCHECSKRLSVNEEACTDCEHTCCEKCTRHPPIIKPPPDPHETKPLDGRHTVSNHATSTSVAPTTAPLISAA